MKYVEASKLVLNTNNPRQIKNKEMERLVDSVKRFPQMAEVRPIVVDENWRVLGGNMRARAMMLAGMTRVPVIQVEDWTESQKEEFVIKDNIHAGQWDYDILANSWEVEQLESFGFDLWQEEDTPSGRRISISWYDGVDESTLKNTLRGILDSELKRYTML